MKKIDLKDKVFGRLTVLEESGRDQSKKILWRCKCVCGEERFIPSHYLTRRSVRSCGCLLREKTGLLGANNMRHGHSRKGHVTSTYVIWNGMIQRCTNSKTKQYPNYGGRGILLCDRWRNSFENFLKDMGPRPSPEHSLDRIDVNGNYEPSNCRWATVREQIDNRRPCGAITNLSTEDLLKELASRQNVIPEVYPFSYGAV